MEATVNQWKGKELIIETIKRREEITSDFITTGSDDSLRNLGTSPLTLHPITTSKLIIDFDSLSSLKFLDK